MKYQIEMEPLAGRHVVALKNPETGDLVKVFVVNASAAEMLQLHRDGMGLEELTRVISEKYGVPSDRIRTDAEALLNKLK